ncbi:phosphoglucosamine mutase [bacterium]|nr:phosphoglucosamine mutase [bacterium]
MKQPIFSISGVRGTVPDSLSPNIVFRLGIAFAKTQPKGKIFLGQDTRPTGAELLKILQQALESQNREFIDVGICPTPTAQFEIEHGDFAGGIIVTASHNPLPYNGLKFINSDGVFCDSTEVSAIFSKFEKQSATAEKMEPTCDAEIFLGENHLSAILEHPIIDAKKIRKKRFKIAVDAVNGVGSVMMPNLLRKLGCEVIELYCEPNGKFPRGAEPLPENLGVLSQTVRENSADFGVAMDPDGDRLALVDENGNPLGEEKTLPLAVDVVLEHPASNIQHPEPSVVVNLSTSMIIESVCKKYGATLHRTEIGEINVVKQMQKLDSIIGGEGNGGVIFPEIHSGRDAFVGVALILQKMAQSGKTISQLSAELPNFFITKSKIELACVDYKVMLEKIKTAFDDAEIDERDGIKFSWHDRWVHIRKSNTEPIVRIYAEAPTKRESQELLAQIKKNLA